ncbi:probable LRR receptor-like serine/threonine-protein kinase At3g47570 [Hibiscus syriacus]|uniref:probable LRR receptor-like serine/threonine-protein kinase At3g47570 n=1 Tax=Hibiscus syriacus TaxID=106335 RepID=UPI0019248DD5|nr:probable LRR receptor-like serine/threonine-protein kinase At3g47570 [Hibiscus syriacus]
MGSSKKMEFLETWSDEYDSNDEDEVANLCHMAIEGDSMPQASESTKLDLQFLGLSGSLSPYTGNLRQPVNRRNTSFVELLDKAEIHGFWHNILRGSIPPSLGNLSSLEVLALMVNGLTRTMPESLGQLANLSGFSIAGNAISDVVPVAMFNLSNIRAFDIGANNIQGTLRYDLAINMPYIEFFSISRNPISGQISVSISNASNLNILQFYENRLSGNVPSLQKLDELSILLLYQNHLGHGIEVQNMKNLAEFHVSQNRLSGLLPNNLGSCASLVKFFLDGNLFEGSILSSLSSLRGLEALDVFNNHLSGGIPEFLVSFGALKYLNLSFNDFEGEIPTEGVFKNARSFGSVYKGILEDNGEVITLKVFHLLNRGASRSFLTERETSKNIRHRNLVNILTSISGVDYQGNDLKALVSEFMENGSLEDWLHPFVGMNEPQTTRNLNFMQSVNVAIDVAYALSIYTIISTPSL